MDWYIEKHNVHTNTHTHMYVCACVRTVVSTHPPAASVSEGFPVSAASQYGQCEAREGKGWGRGGDCYAKSWSYGLFVCFSLGSSAKGRLPVFAPTSDVTIRLLLCTLVWTSITSLFISCYGISRLDRTEWIDTERIFLHVSDCNWNRF